MNLKDMSGMLKQVQQMSQKMEEVQKELEKKTVSSESGGGMVRVAMNGKQKLLSIEIEKDLFKPEEQDMLQDLIVAAVNKAISDSAKMAQDEISKVTGGMLGGNPAEMLKDIGFGNLS